MKKQFWKRSLFFMGAGLTTIVLSLAQATESKADLVFMGDLVEFGAGFGAVQNILTMQLAGGAGTASDVEDGKVAWNGSADVITDSFTPDTVSSDPNKTATWAFGDLGITDAGQIFFIWDPAEVGSDDGVDTSVDFLEMTVYTDAGGVVFDASLAAPVFHDDINNPGVGGTDFVYGLDGAQAAILNGLLAGIDFSAYRIGLEASVSFVDDGPDTWLIAAGEGETPPPPPIPEPATMLLFGAGLAGLTGTIRRKRK